MAIRFIIVKERRDFGHVSTSHYTVDAECPELEAALDRGGYGGGPDNDDFEYHTVIGAEVREAHDGND